MLFLLPIVVLSTILTVVADDRKPPQQFEYVALARAYFDLQGKQVGQPVVIHEDPVDEDDKDETLNQRQPETIGQTPEKMPSVRDLVNIGSNREYKIVSVLGRGTDSVVYRGVAHADGTTPVPVIGQSSNGVGLKFQMYDDAARQYSVETDYAVLSQAGSRFPELFPKVYYLSNLGSIIIGIQRKNLRYLVMELLGGSILSLSRYYHHKLPMETVASVGIQCVNILEALHSINLIHGDIHLENLMFRLENGEDFVQLNGETFSAHVLLGDYGKSIYYIDPSTSRHVDEDRIEFSEERNMLFLSPYELAFGSPSRREDIFRLMETLARMIDHEAYARHFRQFSSNRDAILNAKRTVALGDVLVGIHPIFAQLYDYSRSLGFTDRPDYDRLRTGFTSLLQAQGLAYSGKVIMPSTR